MRSSLPSPCSTGWASSLGAAALGATLVLAAHRPGGPAQALLALALVALYGRFRSVPVPGFGSLGLAEPVLVALAMLFGPAPAALTAGFTTLASGLARERTAAARVLEAVRAAGAVGLAGLAWSGLGAPDPLSPAGVGAALAASLVFTGAAALLAAPSEGASALGDAARKAVPVAGATFAVALLAVALERVGPGWVLALALPVELYSGYAERMRLNAEVFGAMDRLRLSQAAIVQSEKRAAAGILAAGVAHEINNPLAVVNMQAHMLRKIIKDEKAGPHLELIEKATERCRRITRQLLIYARPPRDGEPSDLAVALDETLLLMGRALSKDGVEVVGPPRGIRVDVPQGPLMQVLSNLLQNGHQAIKAREGPGRIEVRAQAEGEKIIVRVTDDGSGVPDQVRERIFDAFFTTRDPSQGTGLGLALVRNLVEEAGGTVDLESSGPEGSVFRLELPAPPPDEEDEDEDEDEGDEEEESEE